MQTVKWNKEKLRDKIYAAWIGKNIGGTIGGPYEGTKDFLDVKGFVTKAGEPLPNDDLDLQLMWLYALEREGPFHFDSRTLAEYWLRGIVPEWNEYGVAKANLREGIFPPLSGELHNEDWKTSNGAWIRTEIWACLAPNYPIIARNFAYYDATVDHGLGEGTYAALFIATLESLAFHNNDIETLIGTALTSIPSDCRVAKAVKLVFDEYEKKTPYRQVRDALVKQSADIGWFQAPANIGFVIIGLLYGDGDFKKSILLTVNCGDDTDCTAGTVGAILGILHGTAGIPSDWSAYIGDDIKTVCIHPHYRNLVPKTCTELTERVLNVLPAVFFANETILSWTDDENELPSLVLYEKDFSNRTPWCFELPYLPHLQGYAEYDKPPIVKTGDQIRIRFKITNFHLDTYHINIHLNLPDGWIADYPKTLAVGGGTKNANPIWEATVTVGETKAKNHIYLIGETSVHAQPLWIDYVIES